jgi:exopolysaccharide production protein ExoZ
VGRVRSIQILRGVAASMVVLSHTTPYMVGAAGVDIFFVISGFIIYRVSQGREPIAFLKDRARRILPVYYLFSLPWAAFAIAAGIFTLPMAITSATLWPIVGAPMLPVLKSGWTLSFEVLFYVATAATLAWPKLRRALPVLWALSLAGAILTGSPVLRFIGNPIIVEFAFGILIARMGWRNRRLGAVAMALALTAFVAMGWMHIDLDSPIAVFDMALPWRWAEWGIPAALLVWGALQFEDLLTARHWRPLEYLGDASYSLYLTNLLVTTLIRGLPAPLLFLICMAVGIVAYRYVERPILSAMRKASPARTIVQPA